MPGMKRKSGPKALFAYLVIRTVFAVMQVFPIDWNLRMARWLAGFWPRLMPRHRDRAIKHLTESLGDEYSKNEITRLADLCLESAAMFAVEVICLPRLINSLTWSRYIKLVEFDDALEVILGKSGVILVTGHYGAFEVMGHLLAALDFDVVAVMRPLDNVYFNRFVVRTRRTNGLVLIDKKGATTEAEATLDDGKMLAFIGDQDAGRKGIFVDFFGRPASAYKSIGLLAMVKSCPIVVGYARRLGNRARYEVGIQRIIHPREWELQPDPLRWITQAYTSAIEELVRRDPGQYLWIHRRWKSQPGVRRRRAVSAGQVSA